MHPKARIGARLFSVSAAAAWVLVLVAAQATAQNLGLKFSYPCSDANGYLDTASLTCNKCPQGSYPGTTRLQCVSCANSSGILYAPVGSTTYAIPYLATHLAAGASQCQCQLTSTNGSSSTPQLQINGSMIQICLDCGLTVASASGSSSAVPQCRSGPSNDLAYLSQALSISLQVSTQVTFSGMNDLGGPSHYTLESSQLVESLLLNSARLCLDTNNREACHAVSNLCVLQMYNRDTAACVLYFALLQHKVTGNTYIDGGPVRPATGPLPWLYYGGTSSSYLASKDIQTRVTFSGGSSAGLIVSNLEFVLSIFAANGTWLGMRNLTDQLQLCGAQKPEASAWRRFGRNYVNKCKLSLDDVLAESADSALSGVLLDLYFVDGPSRLYPVPVRVANYEENSAGDTSPHVTRFFYIDSQLGRTAAGALRIVQYISSMDLVVTLTSDADDRILPPELRIRYAAVQVDGLSSTSAASSSGSALAAATGTRSTTTKPLQASFRVLYQNDDGRARTFWDSWQKILIVFLVVLGFPIWTWKMFLFLRRDMNVDYEALVYAVVQAADVGSLALSVVLLVVSLYWLIFIKLERHAHTLMLLDDSVGNFRITVILAMIGQTVGLLYTVMQQIRYDVFFLDWEKPRKVLAKAGGREEAAPVSCWRMMFVANEWNELQASRMTYPALTLIILVCILEGQNHISAGTISPQHNDFKHYNHTMQSVILRFGVTMAWFIVLAVAQVLYKTLLYHRYVMHPVEQFADLLFLANVSCILLDDTLSGHYIHGRNQAPFSDTDMEDLNMQLLREEEGLLAQRGLVPSYQGQQAALATNQKFLIYVPPSIREQYNRLLLAPADTDAAHQRATQGYMKSILQGGGRKRSDILKAKDSVSQMFKDMITDVESNHPTQVRDPSYLQRLLRAPPADAAGSKKAIFVHDYHNSFASNTFYGIEWRLLLFEALLLCSIDMSLRNISVTAFITFLIIRAVAWFRAQWGEANIATKTLVDRHFLI